MIRTALGTAEGATIGFLHTAPSQVPLFDEVLARLGPTASTRHDVRPDLLAAAAGAARAPLARPGEPTRARDAVVAELAGAVAELAPACRVVLVTCSTLGPYLESPSVQAAAAATPVIRIDRPMALRAVDVALERAAGAPAAGRERWPSDKPYVVAVAALSSAVEPIRVLLAECAARRGVEVGIGVVQAAGAWARFESGDLDGYRRAVERVLMDQVPGQLPDVVVLAQASMASLADPDGSRYGVPVLASPGPAVAEALRLAGH